LTCVCAQIEQLEEKQQEGHMLDKDQVCSVTLPLTTVCRGQRLSQKTMLVAAVMTTSQQQPVTLEC